MLKKLLVISFFFVAALSTAQNNYTHRILLYDISKIEPCNWVHQDSVIRDSSICRVYYQLQYVADTTVHNERTTVMISDIGKQTVTYFSLAMRFNNTMHTIIKSKMDAMPKVVGMSARFPYTAEEKALEKFAGDPGTMNNCEIWLDLQQHMLSERIPDYGINENVAYEYEESIPIFDWTITADTLSVCNYQCLKATCRLGGRNWTVWFASEIPLPYGPWKFGGLPGLILKAEDEQGHYKWESCGIEQVCRPMSYFVIPTKKYSQKQFKAYVERFHNHPYEVIDGGRGSVLIETYANKRLVALDDSWTIPYNPIELE